MINAPVKVFSYYLKIVNGEKMQAVVEDPCLEECFKPKSEWRYTDINECISQCKTVKITKP